MSVVPASSPRRPSSPLPRPLPRRPSIWPKVGAAVLVIGLIGVAGWRLMGGRSLLAPVLHVELPDADGLEVGHRAQLRGVTIGRVVELDLQAGSDALVAQVEIDSKYAELLDPESIFIVRSSDLAGMTHVLSVSNFCVDKPKGIQDGARVKGYSGMLPKVYAQVAIDKRDCMARLGMDAFSKLKKDVEAAFE